MHTHIRAVLLRRLYTHHRWNNNWTRKSKSWAAHRKSNKYTYKQSIILFL